MFNFCEAEERKITPQGQAKDYWISGSIQRLQYYEKTHCFRRESMISKNSLGWPLDFDIQPVSIYPTLIQLKLNIMYHLIHINKINKFPFPPRKIKWHITIKTNCNNFYFLSKTDEFVLFLILARSLREMRKM